MASTAEESAAMELQADILASSNGDSRPASSRSTSLLRARSKGEQLQHRIPASQYVALGVWLALLLIEYGLVRLVCEIDVPEDHTADDDIARVMDDFQFLLFSGFTLAVLTGIHWPDRFMYIFCFSGRRPRGFLFLIAFFLSGIGWGFLDSIEALKGFSLTGINPAYMLPLVALALGAISLVGLHLWLAYRHNSWSGFFAYVLSRSCLLAFYASYLIIKLQPQHNKEVVFHFHHYAVGYLAASLAEFNHPLSVILLACGTGVFVQGIAAYDADPILSSETRYFVCKAEDMYNVIRSPLMNKKLADFVARYMICRYRQ